MSGKSAHASRSPAIISPGVDIICGGALSAVAIGAFLAYAGSQTSQWADQIDVGEIMLTNILIN